MSTPPPATPAPQPTPATGAATATPDPEAPSASAVESTVRMRATGPDEAEETVRLSAAEPAEEETVRLDDEACATFLDPAVWAKPAADAPAPDASSAEPDQTVPAEATRTDTSQDGPQDEPQDAPRNGQDEPPLADGELRRFGPGVPPLAAAVWHGAAAPADPPRPRRTARWLVPAAVLLALLGLLLWRWTTPALAVTGVTATTDPAGPGCDGTAVITATVETNGEAGTVRYHWLRSDGTSSGELSQSVRAGDRRTDVLLRWTFDGKGSLQAAATIEILSPQRHSGPAAFTYTCS